MSEENKENIENTQPTKEELERQDLNQAYEELAVIAPSRQVTLPDETAKGEPKTLGEAIANAEDLTDLQYAMARLFPATVDFNAAMIARVDPNVFISMLHLMSNDEIMRSDPRQPIDVNMVYMRNYIRLSIGLDGMGRIDTTELLGAAREEKRTERLLRGGGL